LQQSEQLAASFFQRLAMISDLPAEPHKHCAQFLIIVKRVRSQNGNPIGKDTGVFETSSMDVTISRYRLAALTTKIGTPLPAFGTPQTRTLRSRQRTFSTLS
jgi:hypothetical protein